MAQTPFFSIIIPVYNGLTHDLPICLNSIWGQSLDKNLYEVICVDDCSTDDTRQWLKEQCKEHCNLKVIENEENVRQGGARNRGVLVARGKYILFIDSDDYFHKDGIDKVYNFIKDKELDILVTDSAYQFKGYEHNNLQLNLRYHHECNSETFIQKNGFAIAPWRLCLNREFYIKTEVNFVERTSVEDVDWGCKIIHYAKKIQYQPILLVHYIKAESGTSDTMYKRKTTLIDNIEAANRTFELTKTLYKESINKKELCNLVESYYKRTCLYLCGLFCSIKEKKSIVEHITLRESKYTIVQFAITCPRIFAIISNCCVPIFRLARKIHRKRVAQKLQNRTNN